MLLAGAGLVVNAGSAWLLRLSGGYSSMATRAAMLHLLTDAAASLAVLVAGGVIVIGGPQSIDPLMSLVISVLVLLASLRLIATSTRILLNATPTGLDVGAVRRAVIAMDEVDDLHHLHIWNVSEREVAASAHVVVEGDRSVHDAQATIDDVAELMAEDFGIGHVTIQLECHECPDEEHAVVHDSGGVETH